MLICALLAVPVSAAFQNGERSTDRGLGALIDRLEEQGVDVTAIRAAVEQGDYETARTLMQQFREEHRIERSAPPADGNREMRIAGLLDRLEEQGVDVTAIRAAVEQGDYETARTLMKQVLESRNGALPEKSQNGCSEGKGLFGCRGVRTAE
ncbi:MAG: hypothetical protein XE10_0759 [Methanoculleus marisnigri]|uniref:Uncharacterized protein n=1 Tax=Methanoculleus marisnigri TaxID=2198 RepID=A0A101GN53_9EURY|nr:MAG: hypothetical protein XD82_1102 [Methanoculleus marisnigri]KUL02258.1 MAG: hypothetical protein XE10_0759 [Methanoculleus marisnigri]